MSEVLATVPDTKLPRDTILSPVIEQKAKLLTMMTIITTVADHCGVATEVLRSKLRSDKLVLPRHVAMYLCRELTNKSITTIGKRIHRHHTTVLYGHQKIAGRLLYNGDLQVQIAAIQEKLGVTAADPGSHAHGSVPNDALEKIIHAVANVYDLPAKRILSKSKEARVVEARRLIIYLSLQLTGNNIEAVRARLGYNIATIKSGFAYVVDHQDSVPELQRNLAAVKDTLGLTSAMP